jgi:hypothetical protein
VSSRLACRLLIRPPSFAPPASRKFFRSQDFEDLEPLASAREVLERWAPSFDFFVVTARQHAIEAQTKRWIDRHFPGVFKAVLLGNHWSLPGDVSRSSRSKREMVESIGAAALIDDSTVYSLDVAPVARVFLFGEYGWNERLPDSPHAHRVTRVADWAAVSDQLARLSAACDSSAESR